MARTPPPRSTPAAEPFDRATYIADREAALRSLDKLTLLAYYRKYGEHKIAERWEQAAPDSRIDRTTWAGIHKARLTLDCFTEAEKNLSRMWLWNHGFKPVGM